MWLKHVAADGISFAATFLQKSLLTHSVAAPLRIEPAIAGLRFGFFILKTNAVSHSLRRSSFAQKVTLGSPARLQAPSRRFAVAANLLRVRVHFNIFRRRIFFLPVDTSLWTTHRSRRRFSYLKQTRLSFTPPLLLPPQSRWLCGDPKYRLRIVCGIHFC